MAPTNSADLNVRIQEEVKSDKNAWDLLRKCRLATFGDLSEVMHTLIHERWANSLKFLLYVAPQPNRSVPAEAKYMTHGVVEALANQAQPPLADVCKYGISYQVYDVLNRPRYRDASNKFTAEVLALTGELQVHTTLEATTAVLLRFGRDGNWFNQLLHHMLARNELSSVSRLRVYFGYYQPHHRSFGRSLYHPHYSKLAEAVRNVASHTQCSRLAVNTPTHPPPTKPFEPEWSVPVSWRCDTASFDWLQQFMSK